MIRFQNDSTLKKFNFHDPAIWLATWFGFGFLKPAPGTWGSLAALPFGVLMLKESFYLLPIFTVLMLFIGLWASRRFSKSAGVEDSPMIVIDEVVGVWIALIPAGTNPVMIFLAFLFFRFFDILKPWPVSVVDRRVKGAVGVMMDDVLAGGYAALCVIGVHALGFS